MATIFVWPMKMKMPDVSAPTLGGKALSMVENIGHAALLCDRLPPPAPTADVDPRYVSYWPDSPVSFKARSSRSYWTPTYAQDVNNEGGEPDFAIDLPCLNDVAIAAWWRAFLDRRAFIGPYALEYWPTEDRYDLWRNNCASIVALAMKVGGADAYTIIPGKLVNTPALIRTYARVIAGNAKITDFVASGFRKLSGR